VRPGARIRRVRDLARPGVRLINRQLGSGTRQLIDQLLKREGLAPERIAGYRDEEFTHLAVAATVAAGRADAGFGIRAAAARHKLGFVPLVTETYYLACTRGIFDGTGLRRLLDVMRSRRFRSRVARLPGYDPSECGSVVELRRLLDAS
jgi:putative molybdopterin biosynthesis protein